MILLINNGSLLRQNESEGTPDTPEYLDDVPQYSDIELPDITINEYAVQGET